MKTKEDLTRRGRKVITVLSNDKYWDRRKWNFKGSEQNAIYLILSVMIVNYFYFNPPQTYWILPKHIESSSNILNPPQTSWILFKHLESSSNILNPLQTSWILLKHLESSSNISNTSQTSWILLKYIKYPSNNLNPPQTSWILHQISHIPLKHLKFLSNILNLYQIPGNISIPHSYLRYPPPSARKK